jgi:hypothetical protein
MTVIEIKTDRMRAYGRDCLGCLRTKTRIMVSFYDSDGVIYDVFLSHEAAAAFHEQLGDQLTRNVLTVLEGS